MSGWPSPGWDILPPFSVAERSAGDGTGANRRYLVFTYANILGPNVVARIQGLTTSLALLPIIGMAILGWFWFNADTYMAGWNVTGESDFSALGMTFELYALGFLSVWKALPFPPPLSKTRLKTCRLPQLPALLLQRSVMCSAHRQSWGLFPARN